MIILAEFIIADDLHTHDNFNGMCDNDVENQFISHKNNDR